jgi:hypothetical protein
MKTPKSLVRIFSSSDTESTPDSIATPYGRMIPGADYDRWAALRAFHDTLAAIYADIAGMAVTKAQALDRLNALEMPSTFLDIEQGVAGLKAVFTAGGDISKPMEALKWGLEKLATSVSFAAQTVPKPAHPDAPKPQAGQPLGSGAYARAESD